MPDSDRPRFAEERNKPSETHEKPTSCLTSLCGDLLKSKDCEQGTVDKGRE